MFFAAPSLRSLRAVLFLHDGESLPGFKFTGQTVRPGEHHDYRVIAVNSVGLKSKPSPSARR